MKNIGSKKSMKKNLKYFLSVFAAFVMAASFLASCATKGISANDKENEKKTSFSVHETETHFLSEENVKVLGRAFFIGDTLWMPYSSTGAEFIVHAKRLDVTFAGDNGAKSADENNAARVAVFVNGERKLDELIVNSETTYNVFDGDEEISGTVRILKISEAANSTAGITSISLDKEGSFEPSEPSELKIEFIGDSITCGYGVDDSNRNNHFKTATEDNTKSYAYKTAQALGADYSMVCISGCGIISCYTGNGVKNEGSLMPRYYDKLGFSWGSTFMGVKPQSIEWNFNRFQPDFVVVNLGTNDASYTKDDQEKMDEFSDAYADFLKIIREKNPSAHIICTLGTMEQRLCPAIESAMEKFRLDCDDNNISFLKVDYQDSADGFGADWHPSEKTHSKVAKKLQNHINSIKK